MTMHALPISTNTKKYVVFGKSFYIQTPELENPKLNDIKGLNDKIFITRTGFFSHNSKERTNEISREKKRYAKVKKTSFKSNKF